MKLRQQESKVSKVVGALYHWARRTSTSFAELRSGDSAWRTSPPSESPPDGALVYRLRHWPTLPTALRTAEVLRLLSLMSNRPVNRHWIRTHTRLPPQAIDTLLMRLIEQEALEVIDTSGYPLARQDKTLA